MPTISVVMSVYNDADYLDESINSVLAQEFEDFEFIIVNDGSPDSLTREILADYERCDARIRVFHKTNEGLTSALIDGCAAAIGEYIARIDVGDVMTPNRLSKQKQILEENQDCVFVSCQTEFCGPEWEHMWFNRPGLTIDDPVSVITNDPEDRYKAYIPHHGTVMFRKSAYQSAGGYRKQFYYGQDWDLWFRLIEIGKYFIVPEVLYRTRILPNNISLLNKQNQTAIAKCSKRAFGARTRGEDELPWVEKAASIRPSKSTSQNKKGQRCNQEPGFYFIGEALRRNGDRRCRSYFLAAIRQAPLRVRSYIRWVQSLF